MKKFPEFNASLDGDQLVYKQYFNIGFAADTPNGLVVPVLKDADKKGIMQISEEKNSPLISLFMLSGGGAIPIMSGSSVIAAPYRGSEGRVVGVVGVIPRLMLPLSLSFDHRVIDGALAARFNAYLGQVLADFRRVLL